MESIPQANLDQSRPRSGSCFRVGKSISRRWPIFGLLFFGLVLGGCTLPTFGAYRGKTTQGQDAFKLWQGFFIAGLVVFGIVFALILWAVLRYRRKDNEIPRQNQYHTIFEIFYTIVPLLIVLVLFAFTFVTENNVDTVSKAHSVTVTVTAFQWGWTFSYPTYHVKVIGAELQNPQMVLPVDETVHVTLKSADVIHGFYVPQFNFSRYAQPFQQTTVQTGTKTVNNHFDLTITQVGTFRGQCTQLCGLYHSLMIFRVKAVEPQTFQTWIKKKQSSPTNADSITAAKAQLKNTNVGLKP